MASSPTKILLVEDDEADVLHFQRLSRKLSLSAEVVVASNGESALEVLRRDGRQDDRYLVVTDLNMPGIDGHELIAELRQDDKLSASVVFVFSTSDLPDDIELAYRQHVAGYIVKDDAGERLEAGIMMLERYCRAVTLI